MEKKGIICSTFNSTDKFLKKSNINKQEFVFQIFYAMKANIKTGEENFFCVLKN